LYVFSIFTIFAATANAQVGEIEKFCSFIKTNVSAANNLIKQGQVKQAIARLNKVNRYIDYSVSFELEEKLRKALNSNPGLVFRLDVNLDEKFTSAYWRNRYDRAQASLSRIRSALSGVSSLKTLDRQDEAWAYMKTIYNSIKTVKDVVENVTTQEYYDAIKSANEGVNGFIENYREIEKTHLQKLETELFQMEINGLTRRAKKTVAKIEPVLSYMKANAEEGDRFKNLLKRVDKIRNKVFSGQSEKMVFGDKRFTWNYEDYSNAVKELCAEFVEYEFKKSEFSSKINQIKKNARKNWEKIRDNIDQSGDKRQKEKFLKWAKESWDDFDGFINKKYSQAIASVDSETDLKKNNTGKPALFLGANEESNDGSKSDSKKPAFFAGAQNSKAKKKVSGSKPDLFAGAGSKSSAKKAKATTNNKVDLFAGQSNNSAKNSNQRTEAIKLGSVLSNGKGNNKSKGGGTYLGVDLNKVGDDDLIGVVPRSGKLKFVHINLRNSRGMWFSIYNGVNTIFKVKDLIKNQRSGFTHINFTVNGQHERYLPVYCKADVMHYKKGSIPGKIQRNFRSQWQAGNGEIPNKFMQKRKGLWLKGRKSHVSASTTSTEKQTDIKTKSSNANSSNNRNKDKDKTKTGLKKELSVSKLRDKELRKLVAKINGILQAADEDFNRKYWEKNGAAKTTQKAKNPKASALKILKKAIRVAGGAKFNQNQVTLSYMIARKLINYSGRVFVYVGKREFFIEAAHLLHRAENLLDKVKKDKVGLSFDFVKQAEMWRLLGKKALVGGHSYNKNACYKREVACYERALNIYPKNYKAKRALNK
jgi:hypothetical protein